MKHIAAYALLVLSGKEEPSAADVEKVVKGAGGEADKEKIKTLCEALKGKKFSDLVAEGTKALGAMGTGSAGPAAAGGEAAAASAPKEEVKVEEEEDDDVEMDGLFGGDDDY